MQATILLVLVSMYAANGQKVGAPDPCGEPLQIGPCKAAVPRYFYNSTSLQCDHFIWGGCTPNGNNFETKRRCENTCVVGGRGCLHERRWYRNGASITNDPCFFCDCADGFVACTVVDCFIQPNCTNPIRPSGRCCPVCPSDPNYKV